MWPFQFLVDCFVDIAVIYWALLCLVGVLRWECLWIYRRHLRYYLYYLYVDSQTYADIWQLCIAVNRVALSLAQPLLLYTMWTEPRYINYLLELCSSGVELIALLFNAIEVAFRNRGWLELSLSEKCYTHNLCCWMQWCCGAQFKYFPVDLTNANAFTVSDDVIIKAFIKFLWCFVFNWYFTPNIVST